MKWLLGEIQRTRYVLSLQNKYLPLINVRLLFIVINLITKGDKYLEYKKKTGIFFPKIGTFRVWKKQIYYLHLC